MSTFTVDGRGRFPLDMLRYDRCWPRGSEDAAEIARAMTGDPTRRRITLGTVETLLRLTPGRWQSFGWKIVAACGPLTDAMARGGKSVELDGAESIHHALIR